MRSEYQEKQRKWKKRNASRERGHRWKVRKIKGKKEKLN